MYLNSSNKNGREAKKKNHDTIMHNVKLNKNVYISSVGVWGGDVIC